MRFSWTEHFSISIIHIIRKTIEYRAVFTYRRNGIKTMTIQTSIVYISLMVVYVLFKWCFNGIQNGILSSDSLHIRLEFASFVDCSCQFGSYMM